VASVYDFDSFNRRRRIAYYEVHVGEENCVRHCLYCYRSAGAVRNYDSRPDDIPVSVLDECLSHTQINSKRLIRAKLELTDSVFYLMFD